jgi:hypothetical protein
MRVLEQIGAPSEKSRARQFAKPSSEGFKPYSHELGPLEGRRYVDDLTQTIACYLVGQ